MLVSRSMPLVLGHADRDVDNAARVDIMPSLIRRFRAY